MITNVTVNRFVVPGSGVVGGLMAVDEVINVSFVDEGVGVRIENTLLDSCGKDDEVGRTRLETGVRMVVNLIELFLKSWIEVTVSCVESELDGLNVSCSKELEIIRDDEDADVEYGTVLEFEVDELVVCSSMELDDGRIREDVV